MHIVIVLLLVRLVRLLYIIIMYIIYIYYFHSSTFLPLASSDPATPFTCAWVTTIWPENTEVPARRPYAWPPHTYITIITRRRWTTISLCSNCTVKPNSRTACAWCACQPGASTTRPARGALWQGTGTWARPVRSLCESEKLRSPLSVTRSAYARSTRSPRIYSYCRPAVFALAENPETMPARLVQRHIVPRIG